MSERVDVLAYLAGPCPKQQAARAAVAELIEADREFDEAMQEEDSLHDSDETFGIAVWDKAHARLRAAIQRRAAALARVGGAS